MLCTLDIAVLIHIDLYETPVPNRNNIHVIESIRILRDNGIIDLHGDIEFAITEKGRAFIQLIRQTPYPEESVGYVDPRSGKQIKT